MADRSSHAPDGGLDDWLDRRDQLVHSLTATRYSSVAFDRFVVALQALREPKEIRRVFGWLSQQGHQGGN